MITSDRLVTGGKLLKTHGIKGEITAALDIDVDLADVKCIVISVDGLYVPFFVEGVRPKSAETVLLTIDGVDTQEKAAEMCGTEFFLLKDDPAVAPALEVDDEEGVYAEDLLGYSVVDDDAGSIGKITEVNTTTDNALFVVETDNGDTVYIPVAEELISDVDIETRTLRTSLPSGLLDLNR